jgi:hypothetical protein
MKKILFFIPLLYILSSCIEILDDIKFNPDGSGTFKYTINLSSSKVKINSILALDSLDGKKVPSKKEIQQKIDDFTAILSCQEGISNLHIDTNYTQYVFKVQFDFSDVFALQKGLEQAFKRTVQKLENEELSYEWISWNGSVLIRKVPDINKYGPKSLKSEDSELLKLGNYTSITRFDNVVNRFENESAKLSKNQRAVMLRNNIFDVLTDHHIMDNKIYVDSTKY